ncbi:MAG: hypothetical protein RIA38_03375 [Microcella pacifica]|uniref:hypothetical protein n=1 Tax=Microcella pacifica TaxID=2591847 RepID=UPI0033152346
MERTGADVNTFLASLDGPHAETMRTLDALIGERLGGRERELWEGVFWGGTEQRIIGYARIEQPRSKGESVEWFLLGLAQQQKHVSLYVNAVADGGYLLAQYQGRLGSLKQGAAALTIPSLEKADLDGLASLVDDAFATLTS